MGANRGIKDSVASPKLYRGDPEGPGWFDLGPSLSRRCYQITGRDGRAGVPKHLHALNLWKVWKSKGFPHFPQALLQQLPLDPDR